MANDTIKFELGGGCRIIRWAQTMPNSTRQIAFERIGGDGVRWQRSQWFPHADAAFEAYANNQLDYHYEQD